MPMMNVAEAAGQLGVSPRRVRQMLVDGALQGQRVGRAWIIDADRVRLASHRRPEVGRRWSAPSAWAVLALADGDDLPLSAVERSRAKQRLAKGLHAIERRLDARAAERWFYAHPGVLDRLANAPQIVRSGVSAVADYEVDLVVSEAVEGYVRSSDVAELVRRFGLDVDAGRPNVLIRVVDDAAWPFQAGQDVAGRAAVAMDLFGSSDPRSRRAGAELMERP